MFSFLVSKPLILFGIDPEVITMILVLFLTITLVTALSYYRVNSKLVWLIIFFSMFLKLLLLLIGYFELIILPHTGKDSVAFHNEAYKFYIGESSLAEVRRGNYSIFLGFFYKLLFPSTLLAQFFNLYVSVLGSIFFYKTLCKLRINKKISTLAMFLMCIFPHALIFSVILLRESIITFLLIYGIFYFINWYYQKEKFYFVVSTVAILLASTLHSGVIVILIPFVIGFIFLKNGKMVVTNTTLIKFSLVLIISTSIYIFFNQVFLAKFSAFDSREDIYEMIGAEAGGSAYLTWIEINNGFQAIAFIPLKVFYFLFSPLPIDWRGGSDIVSFMLDSSFYVICVYFIVILFKLMRKMNLEDRMLYMILISSLLLAIIVFSYGTVNSGTALRHRYKVYPLFLVLLSVSLSNLHFYKATAKKNSLLLKRFKRKFLNSI